MWSHSIGTNSSPLNWDTRQGDNGGQMGMGFQFMSGGADVRALDRGAELRELWGVAL